MGPAITKALQVRSRPGLFQHEVTQQISGAAGRGNARALLQIVTGKVIIIT